MKKNDSENVVYVSNQPPKKKSSVKFILIAVIAVVVGGGIISSVSDTKTNPENSAAVLTNTDKKTTEEKTSVTSNESPKAASDVKEISNVIYDKDGIKITYKGLEKEYVSVSLKLLIENNNSEKYTVQATDITIDGYTMGTLMSASVSPGKKTNDTITLLNSYLKDNGLSADTISEAEMDVTIWSESNILDHQKETLSFHLR